ncbi:MAG: sec-independent protein translocase protein TatC [Bacteroidetes bacterium]|nr:MAG: sec-independent protein translocase protein TatC [Bacteroidota bacterium]
MSKTEREESSEKEMSFWDHLEELRTHIVRSVISIVVLGAIAFLNRRILFDEIILGPSRGDFITNRFFCYVAKMFSIDGLCLENLNIQIININMSGQFMMHFYISFITGVILAFPFILNEIWRFVRPALKENESKASRKAVIISSALFFIGVLFSYYVIVPLTVNFFGSYQVSASVLNQISLNSYISTVVSTTFAVGIVFEMPLIIYFLTKIGIVTPAFLKRNRKYTLVILLIISAIITPPDVFSQILVCIPLMGLYELSIFASERITKKERVSNS